MSLFKNMNVNQKLFLPNLLYLLLVVVVLFFFISSSSLMKDLTAKQNGSRVLMTNVRNTVLVTKDFIHHNISYDNLLVQYDKLLAQKGASEIASFFNTILSDLEKFESMRAKNEKIEKQINALTDSSKAQSNGYIENVVKKLIDEQKRNEVTGLERQVIIGANINTSSNYEVQVLFARLKEDLNAKEQFFQFVQTLVNNTEKDLKALKGTPFEGMPKAAMKANLEIKSLANAFVNNTEEMHTLQENILANLENSMVSIDRVMDGHNQGFIGKIKNYFYQILVVLLFTIVAGVIISLLISKSISDHLKRSMAGLLEASDSIASASGQVASAGQQLSDGAMTQASAVEETSASLEEMSSMTKRNSENANQADSLMTEVNSVVKNANGSMSDLTVSMKDISSASEDISKIIKTIDEIAFQTNLLALNAAVEAARAGEAGAGFAVVADEVRNLAIRSAEAAKDTAALIEGTTKKIKDGDHLVEITGKAFEQISESAKKVSAIFSEISSASSEQAQGIKQINDAVAKMDAIAQENASTSEESASAAEVMSGQAVEMKKMIDDLETLVGAGATKKNKIRMTFKKESALKSLPGSHSLQFD